MATVRIASVGGGLDWISQTADAARIRDVRWNRRYRDRCSSRNAGKPGRWAKELRDTAELVPDARAHEYFIRSAEVYERMAGAAVRQQ